MSTGRLRELRSKCGLFPGKTLRTGNVTRLSWALFVACVLNFSQSKREFCSLIRLALIRRSLDLKIALFLSRLVVRIELLRKRAFEAFEALNRKSTRKLALALSSLAHPHQTDTDEVPFIKSVSNRWSSWSSGYVSGVDENPYVSCCCVYYAVCWFSYGTPQPNWKAHFVAPNGA